MTDDVVSGWSAALSSTYRFGSRAYGWLRLPVPVRPELGEPLPGWLPDWASTSGLGVVAPGLAAVPPTDGGVVGLGVGRSDGVAGVTPGAVGVPGFEPRPEPEPAPEPEVDREAGELLGMLLGVDAPEPA